MKGTEAARQQVTRALKNFTNKAKRGLKPSIYFHSCLALVLNLLALVASEPFKLLPKELYWVFIPLSLISTYRFFYTFKTYDIYDFETLYAHFKQGVGRAKLEALKATDPYKYYFKILAHLAERFPGVHFEYKLTKRVADYPDEQSACRRLLTKVPRKIWKNLVRSILFWRVPSAGERFVNASEETHIRMVRAEYWQQDEIKWIYFMYLNLPVIITLFYGGYQMIFIDILFIFLASKLHEVSKAQGFGDRLIKEALGKIEKDS